MDRQRGTRPLCPLPGSTNAFIIKGQNICTTQVSGSRSLVEETRKYEVHTPTTTYFCRTGRCGNFFANSHPAYYKFYRFQGAHFSCWTKISKTGGWERYSRIWDKTYYLTFVENLHQNERNWTGGWGIPRSTCILPMDPPMHFQGYSFRPLCTYPK